MMQVIDNFMNSPVTGMHLVMACAITFTLCGLATVASTPGRKQ